MLLLHSRACNQASQNTAAFYVNGPAETETNIRLYGTAPATKCYSRSEKWRPRSSGTEKNTYLPPLHFKLGLIKEFVKAMDKTGDALQFLKTIFPRLRAAKIKERVFVGPQIRQRFQDSTFIEYMDRKKTSLSGISKRV
ncbi:hypothetical protein FHG87_021784 [Trinorchestia longiramus]|nr:hypothetical protein FHG87_021784 [Trinorchestia longiramus]